MPIDLAGLITPNNLIIFIIVFTRLSGLFASAPLISTYPIPFQVKAFFISTITFIMFPIVLAKTGLQIPTNIPELTIILIKEFLIGYIVGFVANVVFVGVEIAADLISMQMGLTAATAMNPMTGSTSPVLTQAYTIIASMVFMGINGYQWLFSSIYKTFQLLPPGYEFIFSGTLTHNVIYITSQMFIIGIGVALPIFSVLTITDILLGFVSKMMPKMNVFMVSLPVKIYLGLLLFIMLIPAIVTEVARLLEKYLSSIFAILGG